MDDVSARGVVAGSAQPSRPGVAALYGGVTPDQSGTMAIEPTPCDLVGLYTARTAERLCGLRGVIHEHRAAGPLTLGVPGPRPAGSSQVYIGEMLHVGRGTSEHRIGGLGATPTAPLGAGRLPAGRQPPCRRPGAGGRRCFRA